MTKLPEAGSPILDAAMKLDDELRLYEKLTDEVARATVNSEKSLARATRTMQEAAACHERIMERVGVMAGVMGQTQTRQKTCAERLVEAGQVLSARATVFQELIARYKAVGDLSKALNARAAEIAARKEAGAAAPEILESVQELLGQVAEAATQTAALAQSAREADFVDMAREADSLKQQLLAVRNQMMLAHRMKADAPS